METNQDNLNGEQINFCQLINKFNISVPIIQRDYAQGRRNEEEIRESFLSFLFLTLENNVPVTLDFIYGSLEKDSLIPLDGQQRLTTLFLLHWYLAIRDFQFEDFKNKMSDTHGNSKFTYETRSSSKDFCNGLIMHISDFNKNFEDLEQSMKLSDIIIDSSWYFLSWNNDPTIRAMLIMLDSIHEKFKNSKGFYQKIINYENPLITFQFLRLDDFKLSDDIYIKMNARGKLLTGFESFKAWMEKYIREKSYNIEVENWENKLDVEWTDLFWKFKEINKYEIDNEYYNFFKMITLYIFVSKLNSNNLTQDTISLIQYLMSLDNVRISILEKVINERCLNNTFKILSYFEKEGYKYLKTTLINLFDSNNFLLKKLIGAENNKLNYTERTFLFAFIIFLLGKNKKLIEYNENDNLQLFRWMRLSKNIIYNTTIEKIEDFIIAVTQILKLIRYIKNNEFDVYGSILKEDLQISFLSPTQFNEEKVKSNLILNDKTNNWEIEFIKYEKHPYFLGQIGFLLEFSKDKDNNYNFILFNEYAQKAAYIFGKIIYSNKDYIFERALLSKENYLMKLGWYNDNFCKPDVGSLRTREENWRRVFKNKQGILKNLLDDIKSANIENELIKNIEDFIKQVDSGVKEKDWKYHIIKNKDLLSYCKERLIRMNNENDIVLLKRTRLNGYHAELYTYSFYLEFLENNKFNYNPFTTCQYIKSRGDEHSYIYFNGIINTNRYVMHIIFTKGKYEVTFKTVDNEAIIDENVQGALKDLGFIKDNNEQKIYVPKNNENDLLELIGNLCNKLRLLH